jgi:ribosomal protein S18 acetylase RimI-like enzyme
MDSKMPPTDRVDVAGAPNLPGLTFRRFRGEPDYPPMVALIEGSKEVDGLERTDTVEDLARFYNNLVNCDPYQDVLFAEVDGDVVGYSRVMWAAGPEGQRHYRHYTYLLPDWHGQEIRRAMLRHSERRLVDIADGHQETVPFWFETYAMGTERHWEKLLIAEGYQAAQYRFQMVRHHLTEIPELPLPEGLEVRPARPEDAYVVWLAAKETFQGAWWYTEEGWSDQRYEAWKQDPTFDPSLWQVARDGDQVAGMVLNYISAEENRECNRKRGYTETICVRRPWRRRGLARALLARSLRVLQEQGLTEAALSVDAENPSGALRLYTGMGFVVDKQNAVYRKPLPGS